MTAIAIAKRTDANLTDQQRQILAGVLFEMLGGLTEHDQKRWRGFWREVMAAGSGEVFTVDLAIIRNGRWHRRHMALESALFESQEQFCVFGQLRAWLKTGSGFVDWKVVRGQLVPEPKSISYDKCDQLTMEQFHADAIAFLRTPRAQEQLWPHLPAAKAQEMIESVLTEFRE
jgi:hypothetical protein